MQSGAIGGTRDLLQGREMTHARIALADIVGIGAGWRLRVVDRVGKCQRGLDGFCGALGLIVQEDRASIFKVGPPTAVLQLVSVAQRGDGVRAEHVLDALRKRLSIRVKLRQILNHMREVLHGPIVEVVASHRRGQLRRGVALEGGNRGRATSSYLLVGETHPHGRSWIDAACEGEAVTVGDATGQPDLDKHGADRGEVQQAARGKVRGGEREATQFVAAQQPVDRLSDVAQVVTAEREQDLVRLHAHWNVEGFLLDDGIARGDIAEAWHRLFQGEATLIFSQARHMPADQVARKSVEVTQAIGDEGEDAARAPGVDPFDGVQRIGQILLIEAIGGSRQLGGQENSKDRAKVEEDTVEALDRGKEVADVKLDVRLHRGLCDGFGRTHGSPDEGIDARQCGDSGAATEQAELEKRTATHWLLGKLRKVFRSRIVPGLGLSVHKVYVLLHADYMVHYVVAYVGASSTDVMGSAARSAKDRVRARQAYALPPLEDTSFLNGQVTCSAREKLQAHPVSITTDEHLEAGEQQLSMCSLLKRTVKHGEAW